MRLRTIIEIECESATGCGACYFWSAALCRLFGAPVNGHMRCAACRSVFTAEAQVVAPQKITGLRALAGREQG